MRFSMMSSARGESLQVREKLIMQKRSRLDKTGRKHFKLRVESCIDTILELDRNLGKGKIRKDVIERFERLRESLENVADETIDERDISKIEEATNQLLSEIRVSLGEQRSKPLRDGPRH
jgi:hypothetical protein